MGLPETLQNPKTRKKTEDRISEPPMCRVLLHNDDFTTMDFVVSILMEIFHKTPSEATAIMLNVHEKGIGICGTYPVEIAETKVDTVHLRAREAGFPLLATIEKV